MSNGSYLRLLSVRLAVAAGLDFTFTTVNDLFIRYPSGLIIDLVHHNGLT